MYWIIGGLVAAALLGAFVFDRYRGTARGTGQSGAAKAEAQALSSTTYLRDHGGGSAGS